MIWVVVVRDRQIRSLVSASANQWVAQEHADMLTRLLASIRSGAHPWEGDLVAQWQAWVPNVDACMLEDTSDPIRVEVVGVPDEGRVQKFIGDLPS